MPDWSSQPTTVLTDNGMTPQSLSTLVIDTMQQSMAVKTGSLRLNRFGRLVIAMIIGIPMWLLIVLLSPLHAYMAAKAASSQMSIQ
jgi:hypothetical protein